LLAAEQPPAACCERRVARIIGNSRPDSVPHIDTGRQILPKRQVLDHIFRPISPDDFLRDADKITQNAGSFGNHSSLALSLWEF